MGYLGKISKPILVSCSLGAVAPQNHEVKLREGWREWPDPQDHQITPSTKHPHDLVQTVGALHLLHRTSKPHNLPKYLWSFGWLSKHSIGCVILMKFSFSVWAGWDLLAGTSSSPGTPPENRLHWTPELLPVDCAPNYVIFSASTLVIYRFF